MFETKPSSHNCIVRLCIVRKWRIKQEQWWIDICYLYHQSTMHIVFFRYRHISFSLVYNFVFRVYCLNMSEAPPHHNPMHKNRTVGPTYYKYIRIRFCIKQLELLCRITAAPGTVISRLLSGRSLFKIIDNIVNFQHYFS